MQVSLTNEQMNRLIEALRRSYTDRRDGYLINYLETVRRNYVPAQEIDLDEIPF